jgi:hypothetical protein
VVRLFRRSSDENREVIPPLPQSQDDGAGGHEAARARIIGTARVHGSAIALPPSDRPLLTRGQRDRARPPETGADQ